MVAIGKAGGGCSLFSSDEDERRDAAGRLEKGLEDLQFVPLDLETVPMGILSHLDQPICLFSLSAHAASVYEEKDP